MLQVSYWGQRADTVIAGEGSPRHQIEQIGRTWVYPVARLQRKIFHDWLLLKLPEVSACLLAHAERRAFGGIQIEALYEPARELFYVEERLA